MPSMRCVGYRQAWAALDSGTPNGLREAGIDATPDRYISQDPFSFNAWRAYALANGLGAGAV